MNDSNRAAFEAFMRTECMPLVPDWGNKTPSGAYRSPWTESNWRTWQAARTQPAEPQIDGYPLWSGLPPPDHSTLPEMPMCTKSQTVAVQSTDAGSASKNAAEIDALERLCNCGKQSMGWRICNSCHKQPDYNYDKTIRALSAATEFKHGAMHLSARKFWEVYGAPITQPLIAEAARDAFAMDGCKFNNRPAPTGVFSGESARDDLVSMADIWKIVDGLKNDQDDFEHQVSTERKEGWNAALDQTLDQIGEIAAVKRDDAPMSDAQFAAAEAAMTGYWMNATPFKDAFLAAIAASTKSAT